MNAIVACDKNFAIGKNNKLLFHIKEDLTRFKELTTGHTVLMGRKTYESMGRFLPNRNNIVLSHSLPTLIDINDSKEYRNHIISCMAQLPMLGIPDDDIWVIGGGSIYYKLLGQCNRLELTQVDYSYDNNYNDSTVFMPNPFSLNFKISKTEGPYKFIDTHGEHEYSYITMTKINT